MRTWLVANPEGRREVGLRHRFQGVVSDPGLKAIARFKKIRRTGLVAIIIYGLLPKNGNVNFLLLTNFGE